MNAMQALLSDASVAEARLNSTLDAVEFLRSIGETKLRPTSIVRSASIADR